jgi:hypothetical protein
MQLLTILSALLLAAPLDFVSAFDFIKPDMSKPLDYTKPITIEWVWLDDGKKRTDTYDRFTHLDIRVIIEGPPATKETAKNRVVINEVIAENITSSTEQYVWDASDIPQRAKEELPEGQEIVNVYFTGEARNPDDRSVPRVEWESDHSSSASQVNVAIGAILTLGAAWLL